MNIFWKDYKGIDEDLWSHEWSKHGTWISTLATECYTDYAAQQEVVDYFNTTVAVFKTLPTYDILSAVGIIPSNSRTWMLEEIQAPLKARHGTTVTLRCRNGGLDEAWYHFEVRGSIQTGEFVPAEPDGAKTNCPRTGIRYPPKDSLNSPTVTTSTTVSMTTTPTRTETHIPSPTSSSVPFTGKGFLEVKVGGQPYGCLISTGVWYSSGTCARFLAHADISEERDKYLFTLKSSKGPCGIVHDQLQCAKKFAVPIMFSATADGKLAHKLNQTFYAGARPGRFTKIPMYTTKVDEEHGLELEVSWAPLSMFSEEF